MTPTSCFSIIIKCTRSISCLLGSSRRQTKVTLESRPVDRQLPWQASSRGTYRANGCQSSMNKKPCSSVANAGAILQIGEGQRHFKWLGGSRIFSSPGAFKREFLNKRAYNWLILLRQICGHLVLGLPFLSGSAFSYRTGYPTSVCVCRLGITNSPRSAQLRSKPILLC